MERPQGREPFAIPMSWAWTTLGHLAIKISDGTHKTPTYTTSGVPFVSVKDFSSGELSFSNARFISPDEHRVLYRRCDPRRGDILIGRIGTLGKPVLVETDTEFSLFVSVGLIRFDQDLTNRRFLRLLLGSPLVESEFARIKVGGATHTNKLNLGDLHTVALPFPPLAEQHRIVAKVNELMTLCDRLEAAQSERERRRDRVVVASLDRINRIAGDRSIDDAARFHLAQFPKLTLRAGQVEPLRQTILNLAVRGRLVTQCPHDEPAAALLDGRHLALEPGIEPWKLPAGWAWSCYGKLGQAIGGGTPTKGAPEFWDGTIPWVSPKDMKVDFVADSQDHISELALAHSAAKLIPADALLMVVRGMILAHSFPVAITTVPVTINQDMKAIVPFRSDFIRMLLLISKAMKPEILKLVLRSTHGTCKLLTEDLFSAPLPIPPLAEQSRIIARVTELSSMCDRLAAALEARKGAEARLLDALLHEALSEDSRVGEPGRRRH